MFTYLADTQRTLNWWIFFNLAHYSLLINKWRSSFFFFCLLGWVRDNMFEGGGMGQNVSDINENMSKCSLCILQKKNPLFLLRSWNAHTVGSVAIRQIPAAKWGMDKQPTDDTFGLLRQLLYSFPPPRQKKCIFYQSYYIHTNGHTIAVIHFVVNKSLNQAFLLFFVFFLCLCFVGFLLLWKEVQAGRTPQLGNKTKLSDIYTRIV